MGRGTAIVFLCLLVTGCAAPPEDMVLMPGGTFMMGNPFGDGDGDERPVHEVELEPFRICCHEVTVGEFRRFVDDTGYRTTAEREAGASVLVGKAVEKKPNASWKKPYFSQDDRHPVVCVSWHDAVAYCNWRSLEEGLAPCYDMKGDEVACDFDADGYRLPTEAEWEYAARSGGEVCRYAWGDGPPSLQGEKAANTRDESIKRQWAAEDVWDGYDDGYAHTAPVCSFCPNKAGLHDVSGNVYEWCWDWYDESYYTDSPIRNPRGPAEGTLHACRDAGFACAKDRARVMNRGRGKPGLAFSWGGFRVARSGGR
jgi:formylglycine-generating enzyme required for sulfatase activity